MKFPLFANSCIFIRRKKARVRPVDSIHTKKRRRRRSLFAKLFWRIKHELFSLSRIIINSDMFSKNSRFKNNSLLTCVCIFIGMLMSSWVLHVARIIKTNENICVCRSFEEAYYLYRRSFEEAYIYIEVIEITTTLQAFPDISRHFQLINVTSSRIKRLSNQILKKSVAMLFCHRGEDSV